MIVTVLRPAHAATHADFARRLRDEPASATPLRPPRWSVLPFARRPAALAEGELSPRGLVAHRYRVQTETPRAGPPGAVGLLTLLRRRAGLDDATFRRRWFEGHSPLAIAVHPLTHYVRHAVVEALGDAPPLDGIVVEHFRAREDLLRPWRFFGGRGQPLRDAARVALDAAGFLDLRSLENHLVAIR